LLGLRETFDLAGKNRLHIAHVNAYLRGMVRPSLEENMEALERLAAAYWMVSETHLGPRNGTGGEFAGGEPEDWVTRNCLRMKGYELSPAGMEKAFLDRYVAVNVEKDNRMVQLTGREGLDIWRGHGTRVGVSFPVNLRATALLCATAKVRRHDGAADFVIDAISTDGGTWRNYLAQNGLALVRFGSLTVEEFVRRVSWVPAMMYGMLSKGHLTAGADADISILDHERLSAYATIVGGEVIMLDGTVVGRGVTVVCTGRGERALRERGSRRRSWT
ncbi:MAG: amidohydrolase family protein, partial [Bacillota bacterium]|nr:amidohydrolase family protein [Bacillota bacterium]